MCKTAAAILIAALVVLRPAPACAQQAADPPEILTTETEKEKLQEALEELEYRGFTPRMIWKQIWHRVETGDLPDPGEFVQDAREEAGELIENTTSQFTQDVEEKVKENFLDWLLRSLDEKKKEVFGQ